MAAAMVRARLLMLRPKAIGQSPKGNQYEFSFYPPSFNDVHAGRVHAGKPAIAIGHIGRHWPVNRASCGASECVKIE